jgi:hypothetical protein
LLFVAFGLNYDKIPEDYDQHTNPTLKKFVFFCVAAEFIWREFAGLAWRGLKPIL